MLPFLLFLGIAIPTIELFLLVLVFQKIGLWLTIGIIVVTGCLGALLWRWQGFGVWGRLRTEMTGGLFQQSQAKTASGIPSPIDALMDGVMIFFAGGLLLTPGVLTDLFGLSLLIPVSRTIFKKWIFWGLKRHFRVVDFSAQFGSSVFGASPDRRNPFSELDQDDDIIEGEIISRSTSSSDGKADGNRLEDHRNSD